MASGLCARERPSKVSGECSDSSMSVGAKMLPFHAWFLQFNQRSHPFRPVVFNKRGHGNSVLTIPKLQSFGDTSDIREAVVFINKQYPQAKMVAIGHSAGKSRTEFLYTPFPCTLLCRRLLAHFDGSKAVQVSDHPISAKKHKMSVDMQKQS